MADVNSMTDQEKAELVSYANTLRHRFRILKQLYNHRKQENEQLKSEIAAKDDLTQRLEERIKTIEAEFAKRSEAEKVELKKSIDAKDDLILASETDRQRLEERIKAMEDELRDYQQLKSQRTKYENYDYLEQITFTEIDQLLAAEHSKYDDLQALLTVAFHTSNPRDLEITCGICKRENTPLANKKFNFRPASTTNLKNFYNHVASAHLTSCIFCDSVCDRSHFRLTTCGNALTTMGNLIRNGNNSR